MNLTVIGITVLVLPTVIPKYYFKGGRYCFK